MKPPVEYVRVSSKSKDVLIKIKRNTGLGHWNEICRIALCKSLSNPTPPPAFENQGESAIDIEWKTFAGIFQIELAALVIYKAASDGIDATRKENMTTYIRDHIERGILSMNSTKHLSDLLVF